MFYDINRKGIFPTLYQLPCQKQPGGHGACIEEKGLRTLTYSQGKLRLLSTACEQTWRHSSQMSLQVFPAPDGSVAQWGHLSRLLLACLVSEAKWTSAARLNSKWIRDQKVRQNTIRCLQEIGEQTFAACSMLHREFGPDVVTDRIRLHYHLLCAFYVSSLSSVSGCFGATCWLTQLHSALLFGACCRIHPLTLTYHRLPSIALMTQMTTLKRCMFISHFTPFCHCYKFNICTCFKFHIISLFLI